MTARRVSSELRRRLDRDALRPNQERELAFYRIIRYIPKGYVSTYGSVAAAAGYPLYHRAVARFLRGQLSSSVPWHRVVGAGGAIKVPGDGAHEQRLLLQAEGVTFRGKHVDMQQHAYTFRQWELD